ncbi:MAG: hypothetical protein NVS3B20_01170 [Polyangiales bacterium]
MVGVITSSTISPITRHATRWTIACAIAGSMLLAPRAARAWCRTTTAQDFSPETAGHCEDKSPVLFWPSKCLGFNAQRDASAYFDLATTRALVQSMFDVWANADCGLCDPKTPGKPSFSVSDWGPVTCDKVQINDHSGNANIIVYRDAGWLRPDPGGGTLALTTVHFAASGELRDVDLEINTSHQKEGHPIVNADKVIPGTHDLKTIVLHELGHFLGLAHSQEKRHPESVMYYLAREDMLVRSLAPDDRCGICAAFPPDRVARCEDAPYNGLALECEGADAAAERKGCHCSIAGRSGPTEEHHGPLAATATLAMVFGARQALRRVRQKQTRRPR